MTDRHFRTSDPLPFAVRGAAYSCHRCGREAPGALGEPNEFGDATLHPPRGWKLTDSGPCCGCK